MLPIDGDVTPTRHVWSNLSRAGYSPLYIGYQTISQSINIRLLRHDKTQAHKRER